MSIVGAEEEEDYLEIVKRDCTNGVAVTSAQSLFHGDSKISPRTSPLCCMLSQKDTIVIVMFHNQHKTLGDPKLIQKNHFPLSNLLLKNEV